MIFVFIRLFLLGLLSQGLYDAFQPPESFQQLSLAFCEGTALGGAIRVDHSSAARSAPRRWKLAADVLLNAVGAWVDFVAFHLAPAACNTRARVEVGGG